jgi:hypothetical protein
LIFFFISAIAGDKREAIAGDKREAIAGRIRRKQ